MLFNNKIDEIIKLNYILIHEYIYYIYVLTVCQGSKVLAAILADEYLEPIIDPECFEI